MTPKLHTSLSVVNLRYIMLSGGIQRIGSMVWPPTCSIVQEKEGQRATWLVLTVAVNHLTAPGCWTWASVEHDKIPFMKFHYNKCETAFVFLITAGWINTHSQQVKAIIILRWWPWNILPFLCSVFDLFHLQFLIYFLLFVLQQIAHYWLLRVLQRKSIKINWLFCACCVLI